MALISRWMIVVMMALFPIASHALALGKLKVHSALNEPLNAEIAFTTITDKELRGLNVSLASRADFDAAGVDRLPFLSQIKFTVEKKPDGQYYLQLRTEQPVDEPYLHLLMQVDWPGGRLVREYTALIDPPYQIASRAAPVETPKVAAPAPTPEVQAPVPAPAPEAPQAQIPKEEVPPVVSQPEAPKAEEAPPKEEKLAQQPAPPPEATPEEEKLGPPEVTAGAVPEEPAAPTVEPLEATPKEQAAAPQEQPSAAEAQAAPMWATMSEYDVKKGDTLWRIAEKARADNKDLSLEQVMLAIYRTNKNAFFGNNVNNLKAGKILKMPEREEVQTATPTQAHREFRAQYDAWLEYKLKLASASSAIKVTEGPEAAPEEKATMPAEKPASAEAAKPEKPEAKTPAAAATAAQKAKQEDLLKIVRSTLQKEKGTPEKNVADKESPKEEATHEQQALAERAATLEESLESKRLENKDLSEKVGIVRSQLKKESRLIELENQTLAQQQAKAPETKPAEPAAKPEAAPKPPENVAALKPEEKVKAEPLPPPAKPAPHVMPKKRPPPAPPKEEEKGFLATLLEALQSDLLMPAIIGVVVLLGGAVALVYLRRRQKSIAEFEESILSADAISTEQPATTGAAGQQQPAVTTGGDTSFLSDFSQGGMGNIHTDEVDPVAEAEVYLAYGRDETAEEILKEAMVKNPDRQELKLKLLEIYHQRNDVAAFETLAEELYAALGGRGGKIWDKVEEMGRKLNPENPMFRGGAPAAAGAPVGRPGAATTAPAAAHPGMQPPAGAESKTQAVGDFDFDLPAGDEKPAAAANDFAAAPEAPASKASMESNLESLDVGTTDNAINFDIGGKDEAAGLDLGTPNEAVPAGNEIKWEPEPTAAPPGGDINPEAAAPSGGEEQGSAQWDETATKLDLAKAYIDMGDAEGARSILQEVMSEGSDAQKQQAQELSAQLA
jgi:pilus assembly protein FimV